MFIRDGVFFIVCDDDTTFAWMYFRQLGECIHLPFPGCLICQRVGYLYGKFIFWDIEINFNIHIVEIDTLIINVMSIFPEKRKSYGIFQKECVCVHQLY